MHFGGVYTVLGRRAVYVFFNDIKKASAKKNARSISLYTNSKTIKQNKEFQQAIKQTNIL